MCAESSLDELARADALLIVDAANVANVTSHHSLNRAGYYE